MALPLRRTWEALRIDFRTVDHDELPLPLWFPTSRRDAHAHLFDEAHTRIGRVVNDVLVLQHDVEEVCAERLLVRLAERHEVTTAHHGDLLHVRPVKGAAADDHQQRDRPFQAATKRGFESRRRTPVDADGRCRCGRRAPHLSVGQQPARALLLQWQQCINPLVLFVECRHLLVDLRPSVGRVRSARGSERVGGCERGPLLVPLSAPRAGVRSVVRGGVRSRLSRGQQPRVPPHGRDGFIAAAAGEARHARHAATAEPRAWPWARCDSSSGPPCHCLHV